MIAVYILCAVLFIIALALILPVTITAGYGKNTKIFNIKYIFITLYNIAPPENNKKRKKTKVVNNGSKKASTDGGQKKQNPLKAFKQESVAETVSFVLFIFKLIFNTLGKLTRHAVIKKLNINITAAGDDAAQTAILYGKLSGALSLVCSFITANFKYRKKNISVNLTADYNSTECTYSAFTKIKIMLFWILIAAISALFHIIKLTVKKRIDQSRAQINNQH